MATSVRSFCVGVRRAQHEEGLRELGDGRGVARECSTRAPCRVAQPRAPLSRVRLVDDNLAVLNAMKALLDGGHCDVRAARTAAQADRSFFFFKQKTAYEMRT